MSLSRLLATVALLLFGASGCGSKDAKDAGGKTTGTKPAATAEQPAAPPSSPDTAGKPAAETGTPIEGPTGTIEGTIKFVGDEIPKSTVVVNGTDPMICGAEVSKLDVVISPETRGIRYVLVWLEDVKLPEGYKPPVQTLVLDNVKCQFEPHAAVITVGSTIEARNSDDVFHTTNLYGKVTNENIPLVNKGAVHKTRVRSPELIGVKCDKHGWMQAYIRVDAHPFHAVTDADGKFTIAGVPAGTYKLKAWHETFYGQDAEVTVEADGTAKLELNYPVKDE